MGLGWIDFTDCKPSSCKITVSGVNWAKWRTTKMGRNSGTYLIVQSAPGFKTLRYDAPVKTGKTTGVAVSLRKEEEKKKDEDDEEPEFHEDFSEGEKRDQDLTPEEQLLSNPQVDRIVQELFDQELQIEIDKIRINELLEIPFRNKAQRDEMAAIQKRTRERLDKEREGQGIFSAENIKETLLAFGLATGTVAIGSILTAISGFGGAGAAPTALTKSQWVNAIVKTRGGDAARLSKLSTAELSKIMTKSAALQTLGIGGVAAGGVAAGGGGFALGLGIQGLSISAATAKLAVRGAMGIAGFNGIMVWMASDNILTGTAFTMKKLKDSISKGVLTQKQALREADKVQGWIDAATKLVKTSAALNPFILPFRNILLINAKKSQKDFDLEVGLIKKTFPKK